MCGGQTKTIRVAAVAGLPHIFKTEPPQFRPMKMHPLGIDDLPLGCQELMLTTRQPPHGIGSEPCSLLFVPWMFIGGYETCGEL